jgi:DNA helicase HerA-like ATPase
MRSASDITAFASVVGVGPDLIQIEVSSTEEYARSGAELEIGSYLKISDDNGSMLIAIVQSYRIRDYVAAFDTAELKAPRFLIDAQPVGRFDEGSFRRGGKQITIPPKHVEIAATDVLVQMYDSVAAESKFCFGSLAQDREVRVSIDGDRFFGKHIGVVGSTGSGKSCTVARILQEGIAPSASQMGRGVLNNSHIVIFDLHGEYSAAFPSGRFIDVDTLQLPYWLMNSEELEEMFVESNEENSHNQISQFRQAVVENKRRHAGGDQTVSYDSPIFFSLTEVINYLTNLNSEVIGREAGEGVPKLEDGTLVHERASKYFDHVLDFTLSSQRAGAKATNGPFNGEFDRFLMRLQGRHGDSRLHFLLNPQKADGSAHRTDDSLELMRTLTGYGEECSNVTIIDLSGIPFEVLSVVVSLVTRLIFTFSFHLKRSKTALEENIPFLLVYEEAHNYVPRSDSARYGSVKQSIERIAKEGRKYGVSMMIVSQRPSEISETVFSQCNNFVAMRLTNPSDQHYVKRLLPDNLGALTDGLPSLGRQEAILIGDSMSIPSLIYVDDVDEKPNSHDVRFHSEWQQDWREYDPTPIMTRWQR